MRGLKKSLSVVIALSMLASLIVMPVSAAVTEVCNIPFAADSTIGTTALTTEGGIWIGTDDSVYAKEHVSAAYGKALSDYALKTTMTGQASQNFHYRAGINAGTYLNANGYTKLSLDLYVSSFENFVIALGSSGALQIAGETVKIGGTEIANALVPETNTWNHFELIVHDSDGTTATAAQVVSVYVNGQLIGTQTTTYKSNFRFFRFNIHNNGTKASNITAENPLITVMDNIVVERDSAVLTSTYNVAIGGSSSDATVSDVSRTITYTGTSVDTLKAALSDNYTYEVADSTGTVTTDLASAKYVRVFSGSECVAIYNVEAETSSVPEQPADYSISNDFNDAEDMDEDSLPTYFSMSDLETTSFTPSQVYGIYGKANTDGAYEITYNGTTPEKYPYLRLQYNHSNYNDSPFAFNAGDYAYLSFETAREGNDAGVRVRVGGAADSVYGHPIEYLTTGFQVANEDLGKMSAQKAWDKVEILFYDYEENASDSTARAKYDVYINGQKVKTAVQMEYTAATNFGHMRFYLYHNQDKSGAGKVYLDNVTFRVCDEKPTISADYNITSALGELGLSVDEVSRKVASDTASVLNVTVEQLKNAVNGYTVAVTNANGATLTGADVLNGAYIQLSKDGATSPALYVCEAISDLGISSDTLTIRTLNWTISGFHNMTVQQALDSISKGKTATLTVYESDMETAVSANDNIETGMMLKVEDATGESVWYQFADAIWRLDDPYYYFTRNNETNAIESLTVSCEADMYVSDVQKEVTLVVAQYDEAESTLEDVTFTHQTLNEKKVMTWGGGATGDGANNENALGGNYQITATLDITESVTKNTSFKVFVFDNFTALTPLKENYTIYPQSEQLAGKTLVSFGDSITGNALYGYPHLVADNTGMNYKNVGIGGACMMYQEGDGEKALSMVNVVDLLNGTSSDWSAADEYILEKLGIDSFEDASENVKKNMRYVHYYENMKNLDLSEVDIVTLAFGTNDWSGDPELIDNETKTADKTSFGGSVRYVIEGLKKANPNLKIVFLTPIYRGRELENPHNSDNADAIYNYSGGNTLKQFCDKIIEVVDETQYEDVYVVDMYENSGINRYNAYTYLYDGLHPVYTTAADPNTRGLRLMGSKVSQALIDFFIK